MAISQLADVARIRHPALEVEPASRVEPVLADALGVTQQRGRVVLLADELDELVRADTSLVRERECLGEELDESQLEGVAYQPDVSDVAE